MILVCVAALVGILVADLHPLRAAALLPAALVAALAAALVWPQPRWRTVAAVTCAAALGAARVTFVNAAHAPASPPLGPLALLAPLRDATRAGIAAYLPEPQASLAAGTLLGGTGRLSSAQKRDLQRSGLAHFVAIDGFKQVVVATAASAVASRVLGRRAAVLPTLVAIAAYTLLAGARPSAVRAALMVGLHQLAALGGRLVDPLAALACATLGMALVEPRVLLDLGLQLSLSATLGIVLLWPILRRRLRLGRLPRAIGEPLGLTLAVTLACLPVTLSVFHELSLVSPLAHVVAVPLLPCVLVSAALLGLASGLPPPLAPALPSALAWLAWLPASLLALVVHAFGGLPAAAVSTGQLSAPLAMALAAALLAWGVWHLPEMTRPRIGVARLRHRYPSTTAAAVLACACAATVTVAVVLGLLASQRPDGGLQIEPLVLSRGQATFIRGPTGRTTLVVLGRADAIDLIDRVADHLAVWEHKLDDVVALDALAEASLAPLLARYPTDALTRVQTPMHLDVGAGQTVAIDASGGLLRVNPG